MKLFKYILSMLVFSFVVAGPAVTLVTPAPASALDCEQRLLGIPPWYRGMTEERNNPSTGQPECIIKEPGSGTDNVENFVLKIALNIVEIGVVVAGYVAFFFLLYGGFQFLTGGSNPSQIEKARTTMLNAIIGLAIALGAVGITNLIFGIIG
jgi:hypothetical protein